MQSKSNFAVIKQTNVLLLACVLTCLTACDMRQDGIKVSELVETDQEEFLTSVSDKFSYDGVNTLAAGASHPNWERVIFEDAELTTAAQECLRVRFSNLLGEDLTLQKIVSHHESLQYTDIWRAYPHAESKARIVVFSADPCMRVYNTPRFRTGFGVIIEGSNTEYTFPARIRDQAPPPIWINKNQGHLLTMYPFQAFYLSSPATLTENPEGSSCGFLIGAHERNKKRHLRRDSNILGLKQLEECFLDFPTFNLQPDPTFFVKHADLARLEQHYEEFSESEIPGKLPSDITAAVRFTFNETILIPSGLQFDDIYE